MMRLFGGALLAVGLASSLTAQAPTPPPSCEGLASVALPDTNVTKVESVSGPAFTPPGGRALGNLPNFCRVAATSTPAVRFEVWLPLSNWNGKFQGVGNGANAGAISYDAMAAALRRGYAVASTDTGHATTNGRDAAWALGHPELVADFGYRGLHVTTTHAKSIVARFYGQAARRSYYVGCSTGGRQGLMEAQRYPDDYDGLIAGAPAANWTRFQTGGHLWAVLALNKDPESYIPSSKLPVIEKAVNAACDAMDGVTDGVLDDPRQCRFDAQALVCTAGQDPSACLTQKQATAVNQIWTGPRDSKGQQVYPPYMRGAEAAGGWATYTTGTGPLSGSHWEQATNTLKYMVFENPAWDFRTFDYDRDVAVADRKLGGVMNAFDSDLSPLRKRGGKLLLYHGWNDPSISPQNTVNYFDSAVATWREQEKGLATATPDFIRLFMVPGMLHCSGGPGADSFDAVTALERWVEQGDAPDTLRASKVTNGAVVRTRPLCAYPKVAVYKGSGSTDDAASFACEAVSASAPPSPVRQYVRSHQGAIVKEFLDLVSIPNVRTDLPNIRRNAELLRQMLDRRGLTPEIWDTPSTPLVFGERRSPGATKTVLFYIHFDGQAVDAKRWKQPDPFTPVLRTGALEDDGREVTDVASLTTFPDDWRVYARAAGDDKGPIQAFVSALDALGPTPTHNIKVILHGEEEGGNISLPAAIAAHGDRLRSDVLIILDGPQHPSRKPTIYYGSRGGAGVDVTVYTAKSGMHSGNYGNWLPDANLRMAQLLATFVDASGRVAIKGFYDDVPAFSAAERQMMAAVPDDTAAMRQAYGVGSVSGAAASLQEGLNLPALSIHTLSGGEVGGVIAASATAEIALRLVKENSARAMAARVVDHIRAQGYFIVEKDPDVATLAAHPRIAKVITRAGASSGAWRTDPSTPAVAFIADALRKEWGAPPVRIRTLGGGVPAAPFIDAFNVPTVGVSLANYDDNQHADDENLRLGNLWDGITSLAAIMTR